MCKPCQFLSSVSCKNMLYFSWRYNATQEQFMYWLIPKLWHLVQWLWKYIDPKITDFPFCEEEKNPLSLGMRYDTPSKWCFLFDLFNWVFIGQCYHVMWKWMTCQVIFKFFMGKPFYYAPTSKKLTRHIGFGLSVHPSVRQKPCMLGFWNFIYGFLMEK